MKLAWCAIALALAGAGEKDKETWPLTLRDAIRIGLDNSEIVRVIFQGKAAIPIGNCFGPPCAAIPPIPIDLPKGIQIDRSSLVIGRLNADVSIPRFESAVMADIRSINRQYWSLAEAYAALWTAAQTVHLGQEVVSIEQANLTLPHGGIADVAEAAQRLEAFQKVLASRKTEVQTSEHSSASSWAFPNPTTARSSPSIIRPRNTSFSTERNVSKP